MKICSKCNLDKELIDFSNIDHKKPITKFDKSTDLRIINCLSNLQPLWKSENLSKGNRF